MAEHRQSGAACTILTAVLDDPTGYGRIVRVGNDDRVPRIVEQADATPDELEIDEINTGIYCFRRSLLAPALRLVHPDNVQGEYYLTDVVEVLADAGHKVVSWSPTTRTRPPASTIGPSWPPPRPSCGPAPTGGGSTGA